MYDKKPVQRVRIDADFDGRYKPCAFKIGFIFGSEGNCAGPVGHGNRLAAASPSASW